MRPLLAVLAMLASLLGVVPSSAAASVAADDPAVGERTAASRATAHGRWLVDPQGRALVLHGLNMVYKLAPYAPDQVGFGRDDARFLARQGFTTVRLGLCLLYTSPSPRDS